MRGNAVPKLVVWLFLAVAPASARESLLADLEEEAVVRAVRDGRACAARWCWRQLAGSLVPLLYQRVSIAGSTLWRTCMLFWRRLPYDLAFSIRRLVQSPAFSVTCVLTLALGIGATTAMFTLIQQVLLNPLARARVRGRTISRAIPLRAPENRPFGDRSAAGQGPTRSLPSHSLVTLAGKSKGGQSDLGRIMVPGAP